MVGLVGHHDPSQPTAKSDENPKHTLVLEVLELLIQNAAMTSKAIDWEGSNASASDLGAVRLSGPGQTLSIQSQFPWAFKAGNPKKRIRAVELLGTLVLTHCMLKLQGKTAASAVRIPVCSDNQSNVFSLRNQASNKPHTAAVLMKFALAALWLLAMYLENKSNGRMFSHTHLL